MNRMLFVLLASLLITSVMVGGCNMAGGPSKADVEGVAERNPKIGPFFCTFQSVDVIQIGEPFTTPLRAIGEVKVWPVKVNWICKGGASELRELWIYKNHYGEWDYALSIPFS